MTRIQRATICAALPEGVRPTTMWPSWPLERIVAALAVAPSDTLVDLGCGRGEVGGWIAHHADLTYIGVDPSAVGIALASASQSDPRVKFVEGHFADTGLPDGAADAVLVLDALHFATDLAAAFAEIARILKPDGHLVIVGIHRVDPIAHATAAGFTVVERGETSAWRDTVRAHAEAIRDNEDQLRVELGDPTVDQMLAVDISSLDRVWHGLMRLRRGPAGAPTAS